MMYGFGDVQAPLPACVDRVETDGNVWAVVALRHAARAAPSSAPKR